MGTSIDKCNCGIQPVEFKCIVLPDDVDELTEGGLFVPDIVRDKERQAVMRGVLVGVGGNAFEDWRGLIPKVGNRVSFAKFAGAHHIGPDRRKYRLINDKDIVGVLTGED